MRFVGSKSGEGVYQRIIHWIPPHTTYVEPVAGLAAVFRNKRPAAHSILVDADAVGHTDTVEATTRGGSATEWLWASYPRPDVLPEHRHVGRANAEKTEFL